jgi:hypothetical protein
LCSLVVVSMFIIDFSFLFFFLDVLVADLSMSSNFSPVVSFDYLIWVHEIYDTQWILGFVL